MFAGAKDVNGAPIINFSIRIMGSDRATTNTMFLTQFYTKYHTCDSDYYVKLFEDVMRDFGVFEAINGVLTDDTGPVKNIWEDLERN